MEEILYKGKTFEVRKKKEKDKEKEYVKSPDVVVIIPIKDDKVIIERHFRPVFGCWIYEFPAGKIEPNEKPEDAARRELLEETGYYAKKIEKLFTAYVSPGYTTERAHFFLAKGLVYKGKTESNEIIEILELKFEELLKIVKNEKIVDLKLLAGLGYLISFTSFSSLFRPHITHH